jgi:uncharacterized protein DUF6600
MHMRHSNRILLLLAVSVVIATAQTDPPGRVGRMNYVNGGVSFRPADVDEWVPAEMNRPLTTGDHLWADEGARVELHIGTAALRLSSRTAFELLNLDDSNVQIRMAEGSLNIRLRSLDERESFEVDTPNMAFSLLRPGEYRIDVNPDTYTTTVIVRSGEGEVTGNNQAFAVHAGQQARVSGTDSPTYASIGAPPLDEWDDWCLARDRREDQSQSAEYVSRDTVGYQDLDDYGDWRNAPDYGPVWAPRRIEAGWAPYHYGHWVWIEPWGWTWVDDAPWGFTPFHYGRWVYVGYWAWVPGPRNVRPVYAPALVAWVGGPRFSLGVSFGPGVAWFPLGPREVYVPAYHSSATYVTRVNITNTTIRNVNVTNVANVRYMNREAPGAIMAASQATFVTSRPVQAGAPQVRTDAIRSAEVVTAAPFSPRRESVLGHSGGGRATQPPAEVQTRPVVVRQTPPPVRVPFAERQPGLEAHPGRPLDNSEVQRLRSSRPEQARPYIRPGQSPPITTPSAEPTPRFREAPPQPPPVEPARREVPWNREGARPQRNDRPVREVAPQPPPPQQPDRPREVERPAVPQRPPERDVQQPRQPRPEVQPPRAREREAPQPRQPDVRQPEREVPPARPPQPEAQPPRQREREVERPTPQQREAQPAARPERRPVPRDEKKEERKEERKDKKDERERKQG